MMQKEEKNQRICCFQSAKGNLDRANKEEKDSKEGIGERKFYQAFWNMLLQDIFEVRPYGFIEYEKEVKVDGKTRFIDAYIIQTKSD